jgi:hypothetical protein
MLGFLPVPSGSHRSGPAESGAGIGSGLVRRFTIAVVTAMIVLLPASAYPQGGGRGPSPAIRTESEKKNDVAIDKAYQQTLKRVDGNGQAAKGDPWGNLRPAPDDSTKR